MALPCVIATVSLAQANPNKPTTKPTHAPVEAGTDTVETRGFKVEYEGGLYERHPSLPPPSTLQALAVELKYDGSRYLPSSATGEVGTIETFTIGDISRTRKFSPAALIEIFQAVVKLFNDQCVYGIYVSVHPNQLSLINGRIFDLRKSSEPLILQVSVAEAGSVKTTRIQIPVDHADTAAVNKPGDRWIASQSPVTTGSLLKKEALQTYLDRLNRFPGRRVDTALSTPDHESPGFDLNYLIREERPIFVHYDVSNTGAGQSPKWRSQIGLEYRHPTGTDDVLRIGYATNDFKSSNSANASYTVALVSPDYLKGRIYGSYNQSTSEDLGQNLGTFDSNQGSLGTQLTWTPCNWKGWPIDFTAGAYWMNASVDNRPALISGGENFFIPHIGIGTERIKELYTLAINAQVERNLPRIAGTSADGLAALGRTDTDPVFSILRWNMQGSLWLDPLIYGRAWESQTEWWKCLKSQELAGTFRGQAALGSGRLVAQMETVVGGLDSVRGYPEATTAADSAVLGGLEYRFHLARRVLKPASLSDIKTVEGLNVQRPDGGVEAGGIRTPQRFAARPSRVGEVADWDLILRTFLDGAHTYNTRPVPGVEANKTLLGAGFGIELITHKPTYLSVRADIGFALKDDKQRTSHAVNAGDARLHVGATLAW